MVKKIVFFNNKRYVPLIKDNNIVCIVSCLCHMCPLQQQQADIGQSSKEGEIIINRFCHQMLKGQSHQQYWYWQQYTVCRKASCSQVPWELRTSQYAALSFSAYCQYCLASSGNKSHYTIIKINISIFKLFYMSF